MSLLLLLVSVGLCFGYVIQNGTVIPDVSIIDGEYVMDIAMVGGIRYKNAFINGTLVYGDTHESRARTTVYSTLAIFYINSNGGGSALALTSEELVYNDLSVYHGFSNSISSIQILNLNFILNVYTSTYLGGTCWTFRSPIQVYNLANYPGLNDKIQSLQFIPTGTGVGGSTMYENTNYQGLSVYVSSGTGTGGTMDYPNIADTASVSGYCGIFPQNALSSVIVLNPGLFTYYTGLDFTGPDDIIGPGYTADPEVDYNDQAKSVITSNYDY